METSSKSSTVINVKFIPYYCLDGPHKQHGLPRVKRINKLVRAPGTEQRSASNALIKRSDVVDSAEKTSKERNV